MKKKKTKRIAILDDDVSSKKNLAFLLSLEKQLTCVGSYSSVTEAIKRIILDAPDFLIIDSSQSQSSGYADVKKLKAHYPDVQIIILSDSDEGSSILEAFRAGASGYLSKFHSPLDIFVAIQEISRGESPITGLMARKVLQLINHIHEKHIILSEKLPHRNPRNFYEIEEFPRLTAREEKVLVHLTNGCRYREIAVFMEISLESVCGHVRQIYTKLGVRSRAEAIEKWISHLQDKNATD